MLGKGLCWILRRHKASECSAGGYYGGIVCLRCGKEIVRSKPLIVLAVPEGIAIVNEEYTVKNDKYSLTWTEVPGGEYQSEGSISMEEAIRYG